MIRLKTASIVVAVYNEEAALLPFYHSLCSAMIDCNWKFQLLFINDGSTDGSLTVMEQLAQSDSRVKIISFSRNFGHEAAMSAGIDYARSDAVICMDADLQHPPRYLPQILSRLDDGFDVISMVRTENPDSGIFHKFSSFLFYRVLNLLSPVRFEPGASDFFAISQRAAQVIRNEYRERVRYLRGYIQTIGFPKTTLAYKADKRVAGKSKYSLLKRFAFAFNVLCSFSDLPLKLGIYSGCGVGIIGLLIMLYSIVVKLVWGAPSGYTTIIVALCFLFAVLMFIVGIIGQYIAVVFAEVKERPIYIVSHTVNLPDEK